MCGEGGVGRRNALRGERVRRRAGKQLASEWWLTPVSDSSDCRREFKSIPPAARRESSGSEQMRTQTERESHEEERESHEEEKPCLRLVKVLFCVIKHLFWLVTPDLAGWRRTIWRRAPGSAIPGQLSLSLSPPFPPISLSLSPRPRSQVAVAGGPSSPATEWEWPDRPLPPARGGGARAHYLSKVLSPAIPCPPLGRR